MVKFSIITVSLNSENTIERCLNSVLNQTFKDYEHIVIDGASSDSSLDIIKKFSHVKCISEKDSGIYDAMNKGVLKSSGQYIIFLNSDDEFLSDFLLECDKLGEVDFISNAINMIDGNHIRVWSPRLLKKSGFIWSMPIPHAGLVVKRSVFTKIGLFDLNFRIAADFDFVIKLLQSNYVGKINNKPLMNFYLGGISNNYKILNENNLVRTKHFKDIFKLKLAYSLDLLRYFKNNILQLK
ncbi:glycosyltransferase family 2 protein [Sphingobacterium anhuiense]|uniref:glycosyltransferase family 2 protein n=1 Tax=Sphingobacterium anhuiense TaxID=493780 RepID=UPI003C2C9CD3